MKEITYKSTSMDLKKMTKEKSEEKKAHIKDTKV